MLISNLGNINNNRILGKQVVSNNLNSGLSNRNELSRLLFGRVSDSNISFGWSRNIDPTEKKILDMLTDPSVGSALIGGHCRPDGDAYGSVVGLSGILNKMGVKVFPTVDDKNPPKFAQMPSHIQHLTANDTINNVIGTETLLKNKKINSPDLAIIADTADPSLTTEDLIKTFAKAKQIIIIDHHPDQADEPTNKEKWVEAFKKEGVDPKNITYWREHRVAAAEMIGELDKEVMKEAEKGKIAQHNPEYYKNYRIAVAGGIYTDAGGVNGQKGNVDNIAIARLSNKKVKAENGKFQSITRNTFNWLIDNSGVKKSEIDIEGATDIPLSKQVKAFIEDVLDGKKKLKGIDVKPCTSDDHLYIYQESNPFGLMNLADRINRSKDPADPEITHKDLYYYIKNRLEDRIVEDKNTGLTLIAANNKKYNNFTVSIRSYGYNTLDGETYVKDHVFTDGLATKAVEALKDAAIGQGGGHSNATGFRSVEGKSFMKDALPLILKVYKENTEGKDLRSIPKEFKAKVIKLTAAREGQQGIKFA